MYPKGHKSLRGSIKSSEVKLLQDALKSARLENCGCSPEAKEEMRLYLNSWVANPIQRVLNALQARLNKKSEEKPNA
jgi:hypothetical protein